ncbi:MAG: hypothetical protein ACHQ53_14840, partial [Polyangiales bacterium]
MRLAPIERLIRARSHVFVLAVALLACHRPTVARAPERKSSEHDARVAPSDAGRLPEDPVAGKQSELQWREHMAQEEHERQLGFDRKRLKEHRAVVKLIVAARARYDRARTAAAVAKVRTDMPRAIAEVRRRVTEIDRWGVNSRLLRDYDALATSLLGPYADAKVAAIKGDAH